MFAFPPLSGTVLVGGVGLVVYTALSHVGPAVAHCAADLARYLGLA